MNAGNYWQRKQSRRGFLATASIAATGLAGAALAGCGDDDDEGAPGAPTVAPTATPVVQIQTGGTLTTRIPSDLTNTDVHTTSVYGQIWALAPTMNQLIQLDPQKPNDSPADIIPDLAEKWEQPDATTVVFTLRSGVKFHDGTAFTARDAKAQIDWMLNPPAGKVSPRKASLGSISSVEAVNDTTLKLTLSRPAASLLYILSSHVGGIGQEKDILANGGVGPESMGTGPFKWGSYQKGSVLKLQKNPNYHIPGRPYLDALEYYILPDYQSALTNFLGGQLLRFFDGPSFLGADQKRVKDQFGDKVQIDTVTSNARSYMYMNSKKPYFSDPRVRTALNLVFDRQAGIDVLRDGAGRKGAIMAPGGPWAISEADLAKFPGYDKHNLTEAKAMLEAAGVKLPLSVRLVTQDRARNLGEFIQDQLGRVDVKAEIVLVDTAATPGVLAAGDFDLAPFVMSPELDDPDASFATICTSTATRNYSQVFDTTIVTLFAKQSQMSNFEERRQVVQEMEKRSLEIAQVATLFHWEYSHARSHTVQNMVEHQSVYTNQRLENVWIKKA